MLNAIDLLHAAKKKGISVTLNDGQLQLSVPEHMEMDEQLLEMIRNNKALLVDYLNDDKLKLKQASAETYIIKRYERDNAKGVPLSYAQERLWFIDRLQGSQAYHMPFVFRLEGNLSLPVLITSLQAVLNRHEVLRTVIREQEGQGYQFLLEAAAWQPELLTQTEAMLRYGSLDNCITAVINRPFDLRNDYPLRVCLITLAENEHILISVLHHIAADGWSMGLLVEELSILYRSGLNGARPALTPLPLQYADYALWQREYLSSGRLQSGISYWQAQLKALSAFTLTPDHPRTEAALLPGGVVRRLLAPGLHERLVQLSHSAGVSLFMLLLAAFKVLLHRYSGERDITVGSSTAGRPYQEVEGLIGFFINTLVLRSTIDPQQLFWQYLMECKNTILNAYAHQEVPFDKMVELAGSSRHRGRNPLYEILFTVQNNEDRGSLSLEGLQVNRCVPQTVSAQFDLNFNVSEQPDGLQLDMIYRSDLYKQERMLALLHHYGHLLESIVSNPRRQIGHLEIMGPDEQERLKLFACGALVEQSPLSLPQLFSAAAAHNEDAVAVIFKEEQLTYGQLEARSNQLAHYLRSRGVTEGALVPLCMERCTNMPVAILAIMKAGAAYVPIDPAQPLDRITYLLEDTAAAHVVTRSACTALFNGAHQLICIDDGEVTNALAQQPATPPAVPLSSDTLAYIIYTSGSTGRPKGVMVTQANLVNYLQYGKARYMQNNTSGGSGSYVHLPYTFDASLTALFVPLLSGRRIVLSSSSATDVFEDYNFRAFAPYDFIKLTPAHLPLLLSTLQQWGLQDITRRLVIGGEALHTTELTAYQQAQILPEVINEYGPTEATVGSSGFALDLKAPLPQNGSNGLSIGRPIDNTQIYIVDKAGMLCPAGIAGELCIGGAGVAKGYLNRPELTTEKFIANPFGQGRLYRTGDLARWLPDGNLEYLGRMDDQVKLRGYRIEPGEVEHVLAESPGVKQAVVVVSTATHPRLIGYVVATAGYNSEAVQHFLSSKLPAYMVPSLLVELDSIPLTHNGKVDRKQLAALEHTAAKNKEYTAPRNETEAALAAIWEELLDVTPIGIDDNFFELGGHSLLAIRVIFSVRKQLDLDLDIKEIFDHPTIGKLSAHVACRNQTQSLPAIQPRPEHLPVPLSFSQERLWFIDRLQGSTQYHITHVLNLKGHLNIHALQRSFRSVLVRHEILRSVMVDEEGVGYQVIKDADGWQLDLTSEESIAEPAFLNAYIEAYVNTPFDLSKDYMLRVNLIQRSAVEHILVVVMHHIASDMWSMDIMVRELTESYNSQLENRLPELQEMSIQYADYAVWQRAYFTHEMMSSGIQFWKSRLKDLQPLELPADYQRPQEQGNKGGIVLHMLTKSLRDALLALSQKEGTTLFMVLLSGFKVLLHKYTGQSDIYVGCPVAGRQQPEVENLIGFFVNTLVIRNEIKSDIPFTTLLENIQSSTLNCYEHQAVPFEKVVEALGGTRDMSRHPVYQILFNVQQGSDRHSAGLSGIQLEEMDALHVLSKHDINFNIVIQEEGLQIAVTYSSDLYKQERMLALLHHYGHLLESIVSNPRRQIGHLEIMGPDEQERLKLFARGALVEQSPLSLPQLFSAAAAHNEDAVAVIFKEEQLTYGQLEARSNQLAHYLRSRGVTEGALVPLCMEPCTNMPVAILAIMKAGAAYVPIDPAQPLDRITYLLEDTAAAHVVTRSACTALFNGAHQLICIDDGEVNNALAQQPATPPAVPLSSDTLAYIIYTSGSTGRPKGVMVTQANLVNYLQYGKARYMQNNTSGGSGSYVYLPYTFDASLTALFVPLLSGRRIVLSSSSATDVFEDNNFRAFAPYDFIKLTPAHLPLLLSTLQQWGLKTLTRRLVIGGEALHTAELAAYQQAQIQLEVINEYGPTEATVGSSGFALDLKAPLPQNGSNGLSIGRPIDNTQIYIVDKAGMLCPAGVAGELCIGGAGVAKGYLNRPELTKEKFITNPFGQGRLYRTGDLARWLPDGNLEYLGRMDDQVKLRGYRIEPGEVEHVLAESPGVKQAVVVVSTATHPRLIGYIVAAENYNSEAVQHFLSSKLPAYMVPSLLVELDSIPLTPNGKVDRKQLAALEHTAAKNKEYTAPRNEPEAALAAIWEQLLNVTPIGIDDNFFELGGHSLMAMRMAAAVRKITGREVSVRDIFLHPTIAALSGLIAALPAAQTLPSITKRTTGGFVPLSYAQERLWFIDRLQGSQAYHMPFVFRLEGNLSLPVLITSLQAVLNRHEVLRTVIREQEGQGYQFLLEAAAWQPELLTQTEAMLRYGSLDNCITAVINRPFDLRNDYPLRVCLITLAENEHILISVLHHIAADGWSMGLLVEELSILYRSGLNGARPALTPLPLQYADYALWQREYLSSGRLQSGISYWQAQLKALSAFTLTPDHPRTEAALLPGGVVRRLLAPGLHERLVQLSHSAGVSLFMLLLAAFKVLLHRYSGERDITVGSSTAGRPYQEVEGLIGFFINTLVLRSTIDPQQLFWQYLMECKNTILNAYAHQEVPFDKMVELAGSSRHRGRNPLYEILFTVQNNEDRGSLSLEGLQVNRCVPQTVSAQFDLNFNVSEQPDGLQLDMIYRSDLYKQERMLALLHHYGHLLESIVSNPRRQIGHLEIMGPDEQERLKLFARGALVEQSPLSLPQLFSAAAAHNEDAVAVIFKEEQLTYGQLEARSNQLAHYLRSRGVTEGALVPLCMERCTNMPVAILAIMKAGAAYVPIDPAQPLDRITYLLEDTAAAHVVTRSACTALFNGAHQLICIDDGEVTNALAQQPATPPAVPLSSDTLAYIIYTSGSTGRPKGVMVTQANLVNYLQYGKARYMQNNTSGGSGSYVHLPYTFDASLTALFVPLLSGRRIVLSSSSATDVFEDYNFRAFAPYDFIKLTPAHLPLLLSTLQQWGLQDITRRLVIGGEALHTTELTAYQQAQILPEVINEYGPTEATVGSSGFALDLKAPLPQNGSNGLSIGRPIDNTQIYIVDKAGMLCPAGIAGELCIGGAGVAKGYLNRPELTTEKFIANPFGQGRLYRTGDLARWLPDGNLEYLGRMDDQVKLRGYRIEPGEVEHVLAESPGVKQAVVVVSTATHPRLIGYVVATAGYNSEAVQHFLSSKLPAYMVPSLLVELDSIPLTHNGKVDRKQLAALEHKTNIAGGYVAPRNETEAALAAIWEELLDVTPIGIDDNFFELGGDSIITVQVVSRARRCGYYFEVADIFNHQTIGQLAAFISQATITTAVNGEQGELSGTSELLPIQQWYLAHNGSNPAVSHYNQSVLLSIEKEVNAQQLSIALKQLLSHHDALRFTYQRPAADTWQQYYSNHAGQLVTADLREAAVTDFAAALTNMAEHYQQSLDIFKGDLVRMVWIQSPPGVQHNRLLVIVHHLAIDGVSWRILLEDLEALLKGQVSLGTKTSAYRQWYEALFGYPFMAQQRYWQQVHSRYVPLPVDNDEEAGLLMNQMAHCHLKLQVEPTRALLQEIPKVYHTEVNDILLCALAITLSEWTGRPANHIGLEGHGRENLGAGIDTSRTLGWFTSMFPVELAVHHSEAGKQLLSIKEQLRQVPLKGLGYGVLKYLHKLEPLQGKDSWDLVFNYLGQTDNVLRETGLLSGASEATGPNRAASLTSSALLEINSMVSAGELHVHWSYSSKHYSETTIEHVAARYLAVLQELISHCRSAAAVAVDSRIPADYGLSGDVSYEEFDAFLSQHSYRTTLSGLYRLSPLQEGILFHGLYDGAAGAYVEQFSCEITQLDEAVFMAAWQHLLERHSILRSGFFADAFSVPVQCVYNKVQLPVERLDYRLLTAEEQQQQLSTYLSNDRARGFNFRQAPLMRLALIRLSDTRYYLLWTSHHLILDGWSTPVLMEEFLQTYELLINGGALPPLTEDRYEDYIRYIGAIDKQAAEDYWRAYLAGIEEPTLLPFVKDGINRTKGVGVYRQELLTLDRDETAAIEQFCRQHRITVNTLMQGVWSYLLYRYTGNASVTYGVTVSGRPEDLPGIEKKIGLYINSLPLHTRINEAGDIVTWLQSIQAAQLQSRLYQYISLSKLQRWSGVEGALFDTMLIFQNYPVSEVVHARAWALQVENININEQTNYPLSIVIGAAAQLTIHFNYNASLLEAQYIKQIGAHFAHVLKQVVVQKQEHLRALSLLTVNEAALLADFSQGARVEQAPLSLPQLFSAAATRNADAVAVIFKEEQLTYGQLEARSNQLAHYLRGRGVTEGALVPLCMERCTNMPVAILAILKAGAAYVPIDPAQPLDRITYMLEDTAAAHVVTRSACTALFNGAQQLICIDDDDDVTNALAQQPATPPAVPLSSDTLAYIIYTSGSTGRPKGVMVTQANLVNYLQYGKARYMQNNTNSGSGSYVHLPYTFDASLTALFVPLLSGRRIVLSSSSATDVFEDNNFRAFAPYDFIKLTPAHLPLLLSTLQQWGLQDITRRLVIGGEALHTTELTAYQQAQILPEVINEYGPTEATVGSSVFALDLKAPLPQNGSNGLSIGRPIDNTQIYIVDKAGMLCPAGVAGELCIGGAGVAKGYLNRPELTTEKFITNPFGQDRLYRTGDLARWLPDGNLEYLGRMDDQVKLRGYRIEPGEVEHVLAESPGVKQAVVVVSTATHPRLIGYVVATAGYNRDAVQHFLSSKLPAYMVPSLLVELDSIPLTHNGKVDRKQLAALEHAAAKNKEYTAPRNEPEAALAAIWEQLLNVTPIGIDDNFFELGGDSIITIQVVSRARQQGIALQPRDLFNHQTIGQLAAFISQATSTTAVVGEQGELNGASGLLPIQQWYLARNGANPAVSHYNQSVLLSIGKEVNAQQLSIALKQLLSHHDALRFTYQRLAADTWQQYYGNHAGQLVTADLREAAVTDFESMVTTIADRYQQSLDIFKGDLVRMVWIQSPPGVQHNRLLVIVHHLAIDGVSWRILLEDLEALLKGQVSLGTKTSAYRQWYEALFGYPFMAQQRYWQQVHSRYVPLSVDNDEEAGLLMNQMAHCHLKLQAELTRALLQEIPKVYHTEVNDILLCALAITLSEWTGRPANHIGLEGHGRESLGAGIDTSRTLGWFTSMFPVELAVHHSEAGKQLLSIKEQLRQVPLKGLGYGVLKYMHKLEPLQGKDSWDLVFNYLGQTDNVLRETGLLSGASEATGPNRAASLTSSALLEINSMVSAGELHVHWSYSSKHYHSSTIDRLAARYLAVLQELISHCRSAAAVAVDSRIPADYGLSGNVSYEELDNFLNSTGPEMDSIMSF